MAMAMSLGMKLKVISLIEVAACTMIVSYAVSSAVIHCAWSGSHSSTGAPSRTVI